MTLGALLLMLRSIGRGQHMAFITLTEAVDRVLARLADQREGKAGEAQHLPGKVARGKGKEDPALGRSGAQRMARQRQAMKVGQ